MVTATAARASKLRLVRRTAQAIRASLFARATPTVLTCARARKSLLSEDKSKPGRKITGARKTLPLADGGHESRRVEHADPRDGGQTWGALIFAGTRRKFGVEGADAPVQLAPLGSYIVDERPHHPPGSRQGHGSACAIPAE